MKLFLLLLSCSFHLLVHSQAGTPDASFGVAGITNITFTTFTSGDVQKDGKIIAAGYGFPSHPEQFVVARFNTNGTPDNSFGEEGIASLTAGFNSVPTDVLIQSDGKIVVVGNSRGDNKAFTVVFRINRDGSPDQTFGDNGLWKQLYGDATISQIWAGTHSAALQKNNQIVIAGPDYTRSGNPYRISRLTINGKADLSFNKNGHKYVELSPGLTAFTTQILVERNGEVVLAGSTLPSSNTLLARLNKDGTPDKRFNGGGKIYDPAIGSVRAAALQGDGKFLLAAEAGSAVSITRFNNNGTVDRSFGNQGTVKTDYVVTNSGIFITSLRIQNDRKIVASALYDDADGPSTHSAGALRFNANGKLDLSFADNGRLLSDIPSGSGTCLLDSKHNRIYLLGGVLTVNGFIAAFKKDASRVCFPNDILHVRIYPNPTRNYFLVSTKSKDPKQKILIKVYNFHGRLVETRLAYPGQDIRMGSWYRPGIYYFHFVQGRQREVKMVRKIE